MVKVVVPALLPEHARASDESAPAAQELWAFGPLGIWVLGSLGISSFVLRTAKGRQKLAHLARGMLVALLARLFDPIAENGACLVDQAALR